MDEALHPEAALIPVRPFPDVVQTPDAARSQDVRPCQDGVLLVHPDRPAPNASDASGVVRPDPPVPPCLDEIHLDRQAHLVRRQDGGRKWVCRAESLRVPRLPQAVVEARCIPVVDPSGA